MGASSQVAVATQWRVSRHQLQLQRQQQQQHQSADLVPKLLPMSISMLARWF